MNAHTKPSRIITLDGVFERDPVTGFYEPFHPEETRWPLWLGWGVPIVTAWALITGAAWAWLG